MPFSDLVIPLYLRGHMGSPAEITGMRPATHTACAVGMAGMRPDGDMSKALFKCAQVKLDAGQAKRSVELTLPKPKA